MSEGIKEQIKQVMDLFPHLTESAIKSDLLATKSVEITINRILEGQLVNFLSYFHN